MASLVSCGCCAPEPIPRNKILSGSSYAFLKTLLCENRWNREKRRPEARVMCSRNRFSFAVLPAFLQIISSEKGKSGEHVS